MTHTRERWQKQDATLHNELPDVVWHVHSRCFRLPSPVGVFNSQPRIGSPCSKIDSIYTWHRIETLTDWTGKVNTGPSGRTETQNFTWCKYQWECDWYLDIHIQCFRCPHSVVAHIGSVTRDQKVLGLNPVWVGFCGVDFYQWCLTGLTKAWWCVKRSMVACT